MKNLILCSALALCVVSAKTTRERSEPIAAESKGVLVKGETRNATGMQLEGREPRPTFWGSETMPISPEEVGTKEPTSDDPRNAP